MLLVAKIVAEIYADAPPGGTDLAWMDKRIQEELASLPIRRMFPPSWNIVLRGEVVPVLSPKRKESK